MLYTLYMPLDQVEKTASTFSSRFRWELGNLETWIQVLFLLLYTHPLRPMLTGKPKLKQNKRGCLFCKIPMLTGASNKTNQTSAFVIPGLYKNFYKPGRRFCKSTRSANLQNKPFEFRFNTQHRVKPFEFRFNTEHRDIQSIKQIFIGCLLQHKSTSAVKQTDEKINELISVHERTRITPLSIPDLSGKVALLRSTRVPVDGALSATSSSVERVLFQLQTLQTLIEELTSKMDRFRNDLPRLTRSQEIPATEPTPPPVSQLTCPATTSCVPWWPCCRNSA